MIALGTVMEQPLSLQIIVVTLIAILATVGVYGVVALIVRMDDMGFFLISSAERLKGLLASMLRAAGTFLVASLPWVIRALTVIGTIAMMNIGRGGIPHNLHALHHAAEVMPAFFINLLVGGVVGIALVGAQQLVAKFRS